MMPVHSVTRRAILLAGAFTAFAAVSGAAPKTDIAKSDKTTSGKRLDQFGNPLPDGAMARIGVLRFRHGAPVTQIAFSPNGKTIYSASSGEKAAHAWSLQDGNELQRFSGDKPVHCVAVSSDGKTVATGEEGNEISLWSADTGKLIKKLVYEGDNGPVRRRENALGVHALAFGEGDKVLLAAHSDSGIVAVWDVASKKLLHRISPEGGIAAFSASKNGSRFAVGNNRGQIRVWEAASGKEIATLGELRDDEMPLTVAMSADGKTVAAQQMDESSPIHFWDVATGKSLRKIVAGRFAATFALSPDSRILAASLPTPKPSIGIFNAESGASLRQIDLVAGNVYRMAISPDSKVLAISTAGNSIRIFDLSTGGEVGASTGHPGPVTTIAVSPDGSTVATCSTQDKLIRICEAATGREIRQLAGHEVGVDEVTFSPDGKLLASGAWDHAAIIWDWRSGKIKHKLADHPAVGPYLRFSDDSKVLATGSRATSVALWDCESGKMVREIPAPSGGLASLLTFKDGRLLALEQAEVDDDGASAFSIWDVTSNRVLRRFGGHRGQISGVILSADGRSVASRALDKTIRVWEFASGLERRKFEEKGEDNNWVGTQFLAFAPNGRTLVTCASRDPFARRFDLAGGRELTPLLGHRGWVGAVEFSANGKTLVTGSQDSTCLTWNGSEIGPPIPVAARRADDEMKQLWAELQDADAAKAYLAMWSLVSTGDQAAEFLSKQLQPAPPTDPTKIARWIAELDHQQFATRERATLALMQVVDQAEDSMKAALEKTSSAEVRQRIRRVLDSAGDVDPSQTRLREIRAIEVLETLGSPAARERLSTLSRGPKGALLTRNAQAAMKRLTSGGVW